MNQFHKNYQICGKDIPVVKAGEKIRECYLKNPSTEEVRVIRKKNNEPYTLQVLSIMSSGQPDLTGLTHNSNYADLEHASVRASILAVTGLEVRVLRKPLKYDSEERDVYLVFHRYE